MAEAEVVPALNREQQLRDEQHPVRAIHEGRVHQDRVELHEHEQGHHEEGPRQHVGGAVEEPIAMATETRRRVGVRVHDVR